MAKGVISFRYKGTVADCNPVANPQINLPINNNITLYVDKDNTVNPTPIIPITSVTIIHNLLPRLIINLKKKQLIKAPMGTSEVAYY